MEHSKFDDLTKALATSTSRRQAFKTLAATTIGGIFAFSGLETAFAKKKCPSGLTPCRGKCVDLKSDPNNCGFCGGHCTNSVCCNGGCCGSTGSVCCIDPQFPTSISCCEPGAICCSGTCRAPGFC